MPRNLSLNISVGALLNNSVGRTFKAATTATSELGKQQRKLNQELKKVSAVKKYGDRLKALKQQAEQAGTVSESLARRIRNTEARFSAASAEARRLGVNLDDIGQSERRLQKAIERTNTSLKTRKQLGKVAGAMKTGGAAAGRGAVTGGVFAGTTFGMAMTAVTMTNKLTSEQANLAEAVGISRKEFAIWDSIVGQAGLDGEAITDMVEELNNKFGESKGLGAMTTEVQESLHMLRLDFEELKRLKPDQQFKRIIQAAQSIGGQEAMSAADKLMGGGASKIIGYLNSVGAPLDQLLERYKRLYIGTESGLQGAKSFGKAWTELTFTLGGALSELTGIVGSQLAPQLRSWAEDMAKGFRENENQISTFASTIGSTLAQLGDGLVELAKNLPDIVKGITAIARTATRWFGDDEEALAAEKASNEQKAQALLSDYKKQQQAVNQNNQTTVNMTVVQKEGESTETFAKRTASEIKKQKPAAPVLLYADPGLDA